MVHVHTCINRLIRNCVQIKMDYMTANKYLIGLGILECDNRLDDKPQTYHVSYTNTLMIVVICLMLSVVLFYTPVVATYWSYLPKLVANKLAPLSVVGKVYSMFYSLQTTNLHLIIQHIVGAWQMFVMLVLYAVRQQK